MPSFTFQLIIQASKSIFSMFRTLSSSMPPIWPINFSKGLFKVLLQMYGWLTNWLQLLGALTDTLKKCSARGQLGVPIKGNSQIMSKVRKAGGTICLQAVQCHSILEMLSTILMIQWAYWHSRIFQIPFLNQWYGILLWWWNCLVFLMNHCPIIIFNIKGQPKRIGSPLPGPGGTGSVGI